MELQIGAQSPLVHPKLHKFPMEFDPFDRKIFWQAYCIKVSLINHTTQLLDYIIYYCVELTEFAEQSKRKRLLHSALESDVL